MRQRLSILLGALLLAASVPVWVGCSPAASQGQTLTIAANAIPHAQILEFVKPRLKAEGINLDIRVFTDYVQPNLEVAEGQLDANYFQHRPYLDAFNKEHGTHLVAIPGSEVHIEPFGAYSRKIKELSELRDGAVVAVPNDPANSARALLLLERQGLIKLKDPTNIFATEHDVTYNPKHLDIRELEAATLPRVLDDVDLALINTNYALAAGLSPRRDALFIEDQHSPYANLVVTRPELVNSPALRKLVQALRSPATRRFIEEKYHGAIVPAF